MNACDVVFSSSPLKIWFTCLTSHCLWIYSEITFNCWWGWDRLWGLQIYDASWNKFPSSVQIRASGLKGNVRKPDLCNFEESKYPRSHICLTAIWGRRNILIVLYIVFIDMQYAHDLILKCHVPSYRNAAVPIIYRNACHPQLSHIVGVIATSVWGQLFNSCMASCHILYNTLLYTMQWQTTQSYRKYNQNDCCVYGWTDQHYPLQCTV